MRAPSATASVVRRTSSAATVEAIYLQKASTSSSRASWGRFKSDTSFSAFACSKSSAETDTRAKSPRTDTSFVRASCTMAQSEGVDDSGRGRFVPFGVAFSRAQGWGVPEGNAASAEEFGGGPVIGLATSAIACQTLENGRCWLLTMELYKLFTQPTPTYSMSNRYRLF